MPRPGALAAAVVLIAVLVVMFSGPMLWLVGIWWRQPDYQHGFVVPIFAAFLLWYRRDMMRPLPERGSWWGLAMFPVWASMYWASLYVNVYIMEPLALLPALAGIALLLGGWRALAWSWPSIVFLFFMVPLPRAAAGALSLPLQGICTAMSVFITQTLGIAAVRQGHLIVLTTGPLNVDEACSGMRMMMLFFAVCVGAVCVLRVRVWEKVLILLSAAPIAVCANVARITLTAIFYEIAHRWPSVMSPQFADKFFHDMAGLLMMPLALMILWGELVLISKLFLEPLPDRPLAMAGGGNGSAAARRQSSLLGP